MGLIDASGVPILDVMAWLAAAFVFAAAFIAGAAACPAIVIRSRLDAALVRLALGLAILPCVVLVAGQIPRLFLFSWAWIIAALATAFAARGRILAIFAQAGSRDEGIRRPVSQADVGLQSRPTNADSNQAPASEHGRLLALVGWAIAAATLLILLGPLLCPPMNYDALEYHIGVIPHYFREGRIVPIPGVFYSAQPLATEMLYALGAAIERLPRGRAPGLVQWGLVALAAALLARTLRAFAAPPPLIPWLVILLLAHPTIFKLELDCMTDLTGGVFLLAGLLVIGSTPDGEQGIRRSGLQPDVGLKSRPAFIRYLAASITSSGADRCLIVGILAGGALATKWTNAGTSCVMLFLAAIAVSPGGRVRAAAAFGAGALAVIGPWMIWLWARAGNPVAPFAAGLFPQPVWGPESLKYLLDAHRPLSPLGLDYWGNLAARLAGLKSFPGLLILSFGLFAAAALGWRREAFDRRRFKIAAALLAGIAISCLLWGRLGDAAERFLAPVVVGVIAIIGLLLGLIAPAPGARQFFCSTLIALCAAAQFVQPRTLQPCGPPLLLRTKSNTFWPCALGRIDAREQLAWGIGATVGLFERANALPPGSRILAVNEARGYYFRHPVALASPFDVNPIREAAEGAGDPEAIRRRLVERGFTHLLVNEHESARILSFHPPAALAGDPEFAKALAEGPGALAEGYEGLAEFGPRPLSEGDRAVYLEFLHRLRAQALDRVGRQEPYPRFWIAPLGD